MALDLYLAIWDSSGTNVPGGSFVDRFVDPFRTNVAAARPFAVSSWSFRAEHAAPDGTPIGKPDVGELEITMTDNSAAGLLFRAVCVGTVFRYLDVTAVATGDRPATVAGVGITTAVVTAVSYGVTTSGLQRVLTVDGVGFAVGSATQKADGSYTAFEISRYDTSRGA